MGDSPEKIEKLKDRWLLDPSSGLIRPALIEAMRALQDGDRDWERHLETVPYTDEIQNGRDLRGVDFSSLRWSLCLVYYSSACSSSPSAAR